MAEPPGVAGCAAVKNKNGLRMKCSEWPLLSDDGTGCYSDVFYDRIADRSTQMIGSNVGAWRTSWENVMAHELGHLLLGSNSHAGAGIMRARWQGEELRRVSRSGLWFTNDEQADHMRKKL